MLFVSFCINGLSFAPNKLVNLLLRWRHKQCLAGTSTILRFYVWSSSIVNVHRPIHHYHSTYRFAVTFCIWIRSFKMLSQLVIQAAFSRLVKRSYNFSRQLFIRRGCRHIQNWPRWGRKKDLWLLNSLVINFFRYSQRRQDVGVCIPAFNIRPKYNLFIDLFYLDFSLVRWTIPHLLIHWRFLGCFRRVPAYF